MATLTGKTLGGFLILEELGRGAMGVVFKARQLSMDRLVAIKFLPKRLAQDEKVVARFHREARAAGQLSHPNVVSVHDVGCIDGLNYIAMEFVDGTSVHKHVKEHGPFSEKEALEIGLQMAEALKYAHGRGVLHRDIKPDNFLMDSSGRVRLADLGLARIVSENDKDNAELTQDGTTMGTPHYMSPEQCKGVGVDQRSDLYSLGASLYVMASGKTPYDGNTGAAIMVKVLTEPPVPLKDVNPDLSAGFVALVEKTMAREPEKRFQNAAELVDAIHKCKAGEYKAVTAPHARVTKHPTRPVQPPSKIKPLLMGAGAALAALIVLGALAKSGKDKNGETQTETTATTETESKKTDATVAQGSADQKTATQTQGSSNTPPQGTKTATPTTVNAPDDDKDDPPAGREEVNQIASGMQRNPVEAIRRLEDILRTARNARQKARVQEALQRAKQSQEALAQKWQALQKKTAEEASKKNYAAALFGLLEFYQAHSGTQEATQAGKIIVGLLESYRTENAKLAENGDIDAAIRNLNSVAGKLPVEFAQPLKAESQKLQQKQAEQKDAADADAKQLAQMYEKAQTLAQKDTDAAGRKFLFNDAAKLFKEGAGKLKLVASKKDAASLADVYARAAAALDEMRAEVNKKAVLVPAFGNFSNVTLPGWNDNGIQYAVKEFKDQVQTLPYKSLTPKHILQVAEALKVGAENTAGEAFKLGSLAFALGSDLLARTKLEAASADEKFKAACEAALKRMGPADSSSREAQAAQIFKDASAAKEKKDMDTVQKLAMRLTIDFADTDFVKSHAEQLHALQLPPGAEKEKEKEKKQEAEKPVEGESAEAEIKKLGWSGVSGEWTQDPKRKSLFSVKGGGMLTYDADVDLKVTAAPEEGGAVHIYYRYVGDVDNEEVRRWVREIKAAFQKRGIELGYGYGAVVKTGEVNLFGSRDLKETLVPTKEGTVKVPPGPVPIALTAQEGKLTVTMPGSQPKRFNQPMREGGQTAIIIEGNARIELLPLKK
ncbi:MAG TPA: protein kinase [Planctomycetota bacterium]|nr:protein kinase [Planctomycetota bacterium]